jgi:tetratricopeptide (TPR) repeat protein
MNRERANLLACLELTAADQPARLVELTGVLAGMLDRDGTWLQAQRLHERAVEVAACLGDRIGQANALTNLGIVCEQTGDYQEAANLYQRALTLSREIGNRSIEASALRGLRVVRAWRRARSRHRCRIPHRTPSLSATLLTSTNQR